MLFDIWMHFEGILAIWFGPWCKSLGQKQSCAASDSAKFLGENRGNVSALWRFMVDINIYIYYIIYILYYIYISTNSHKIWMWLWKVVDCEVETQQWMNSQQIIALRRCILAWCTRTRRRKCTEPWVWKKWPWLRDLSAIFSMSCFIFAVFCLLG